jgi:1,4-dihydroxy-2-naphthoyl-CoA hydrolase
MNDEIGSTNDDAVTEPAAGDADPRALLDAMPFSRACGMEIDRATPEEVRGRMAWASERCTTGGVLHGGALMALADSLGGVCAFLNLPPSAATTTLESKTNFFRAVRGGEVRAVTHPLHVGRRTIVVETDLYDEAGRRVARVVQTQLVLS